MAVVDAPGCPVRFVIRPGQAHGHLGVPDVLENLQFEALTGDRAFGAEWLMEDLNLRGAEAVIPSRRDRTKPGSMAGRSADGGTRSRAFA